MTTTSTWNGSSDNWDTAADWTGGVLPGATTAVVINSGCPLINSSTGAVTIASLTDAGALELSDGALSITGAASVSGNGTLNVDTSGAGSNLTIGGTLTNSGTVNIGHNTQLAPTLVSVAAVANTGTLNVGGDQSNQSNGANQAALDVTGAAGFGTAGTVTGTVNVYNNGLIAFAGGGQIATIQGNLLLDGSKAFVADAGATTSNSALTGLTSISSNGVLDLRGATLTTSAGLNNAGTLRVDQYFDDYDQRQGGSNVTIGGVLTNSGTFTFGGNLSTNSQVSVGGVNNIGTLNVVGDQSNQYNGANGATLNVAGAAGFGTAGTLTGTVGVYNNAEIAFTGGGQISTVAGFLELDGSKAFVADAGATTSNSALTGLTSISSNGVLDLRGATLTTSAGLNNAGTLRVDQYFDDYDQRQGGSNVTIGGVLTNSGTFHFGGNLSANSQVSVGGVNNMGTLNIVGDQSNQYNGANGATLNVAGAAGFGTAGSLTGTVNVYNNAEIAFTGGGQISTVAGFLELDGSKAFVADAGATTSNSALTGLTSISSNGVLDLRGATLTTSAGLNNAGTLRVDQYFDDYDQRQGGSNVTIGGVLTNSGTFYFGGNLSTNSQVSVGGVNNTGTLSIDRRPVEPVQRRQWSDAQRRRRGWLRHGGDVDGYGQRLQQRGDRVHRRRADLDGGGFSGARRLQGVRRRRGRDDEQQRADGSDEHFQQRRSRSARRNIDDKRRAEQRRHAARRSVFRRLRPAPGRIERHHRRRADQQRHVHLWRQPLDKFAGFGRGVSTIPAR